MRHELPILGYQSPKKGCFLPNNEKKPKPLTFAIYLYYQRKQNDLYTPKGDNIKSLWLLSQGF